VPAGEEVEATIERSASSASCTCFVVSAEMAICDGGLMSCKMSTARGWMLSRLTSCERKTRLTTYDLHDSTSVIRRRNGTGLTNADDST
jgi:hypothetical protein